MWMAVSAEPQRTSLHLSQWTHAGQRHMCGDAFSHSVSYQWVNTPLHSNHTHTHTHWQSHCAWPEKRRHFQLLPVAPAWSSVWTVAAVSWTPTSSQSVAASLIMVEIGVRLTSAETTARMEAHAHPPLQVGFGYCQLASAFCAPFFWCAVYNNLFNNKVQNSAICS